ncbi:MAG TPA: hypothetical protein VMT85_18565 [Thermoanaerobaculia bacterium]|nr:hypothetical protein [Thermoanaerobaculia bacterium]
MRYVAPRISEEEARAALRPRRGSWLRRGRARDGGLGGKRLPHLELVWLPFLHVASGRRSCVVCASTGLAARLEREGLSFAEGGGVGAPAIAREQLLEIARAHLGRLAALAGGMAKGEQAPEVELEDWALPFWVLHFERRPGRLDFAALDAIGGARVGGAVRQALVRAMVANPV